MLHSKTISFEIKIKLINYKENLKIAQNLKGLVKQIEELKVLNS